MNHEFFMRKALREAYKARKFKDVPVGCVIVNNGEIVARGFNLRQTKQIVTKHAEIIAIEKACRKLKSWRLETCDLYVTLEPCAMCLGAIINARIRNVYFGAKDPKTGCCVSHEGLLTKSFNHQTMVWGEILESECASLIQDFFKEIRASKKEKK